MEIKLIDIEEIKPYENNPRINSESLQYVVNSIKEFGFKVPLVLSKDYIIITGHTRYLASKELGLKQIPCIIADDLNEEQVKAFRIADNKVSEVATWDYELLNQELDLLAANGVDLDDFGFLTEDSGIDFIDNIINDGIGGTEADIDIATMSVAFPMELSDMVFSVLAKYTKQELLEDVIKIIEEG